MEDNQTYRPVGSEPSLAPRPPVRQRELEFRLKELLNVWPPHIILLLHFRDSKDLDTPETGAVTGCHVLVHCLDGLSSGEGAELLHHLQSRQREFDGIQTGSGQEKTTKAV